MIRKKTEAAMRPSDPLALSLDDLDDKPQHESKTRTQHRPASPPDFPPCPPERSENTWRLVRLFVETGKAYGRTRLVSPWQLGEDLAFKINHDRAVLEFIRDHADLVDDLLSRMIRIYWEHYVDDRMSRTAIVNQYLDDYWDDLWDQAKTEYATDEIKRLEAAGQLRSVPAPNWHSLANDADYQSALQDLRTEERLRAELSNQLNNLNPDESNGNPDPASKTDSGEVNSGARVHSDQPGPVRRPPRST